MVNGDYEDLSLMLFSSVSHWFAFHSPFNSFPQIRIWTKYTALFLMVMIMNSIAFKNNWHLQLIDIPYCQTRANMFLISTLESLLAWLSDWLLYLISECSLASPGSPCSNLEAEDCKYELGDHCCCGQCPVWFSLACVLNSTTGAGLWQPIDMMLCPAEGCGSEGEWWR